MRRTWLLATIVSTACHTSSEPQAPDAAADDAPSSADASGPDAAVDICPHRSAPAGQPEGPYPPASVHLGDVTISSQPDLDALAGIRVIAGSLTIAGTLTDVSLPELEVVEGDLSAFSDSIDQLHAPLLETVGGFVKVYRTPSFARLATVELPRLESVKTFVYGQVHAVDLACLASAPLQIMLAGVDTPTLSLPRLATTGTVQILQAQLTTLDLSGLDGGDLEANQSSFAVLKIGTPHGIRITDDPTLTTITLGSGAKLADVTILHAAALADVAFLAGVAHLPYLVLQDVPSLASLSGAAALQLDGLALIGAPKVTDVSPIADQAFPADLIVDGTGVIAISFPNVTAITGNNGAGMGELDITGNPNLTSLALPNLTALGDHDSYLSSNPKLPNCQATAIRDHVTLTPGTKLVISGNAPDACP